MFTWLQSNGLFDIFLVRRLMGYFCHLAQTSALLAIMMLIGLDVQTQKDQPQDGACSLVGVKIGPCRPGLGWLGVGPAGLGRLGYFGLGTAELGGPWAFIFFFPHAIGTNGR